MFSAGFDSFIFCVPKAQLIKFLKKHNLYERLRLTNRNEQVKAFIEQKYKNIDPKHKKYKMKIRYINILKRVKSLSNTILVFENTKETHAIARKNKKSLDYYTLASFAGLHQPSKNVDKETLKILKAFLKRFSAYKIDIAWDFLGKEGLNKQSPTTLIHASKEYIKNGGGLKNVRTTIYLNAFKEKYKISKLCWYDKYHKQRFFHKEKIPDEMKKWQRLELTFNLKKKFFKWFDTGGLMQSLLILDDIAINLGLCDFLGVEKEVLNKQLIGFFDLRKVKSFKKIF
ncbi:hypothetical protein LW135_06525 [Helicobacter sp. faydin-H20]|uniref:hypothetical protein n=1 Tax=Helicobacter anatolicus TaxID=2905874 RepID=UPI001E3C1ECC|nr:hypothetical protein [Helicobacter anatolicus]MCE3037474.1 hypothetical protein [Helicobacter anatolicus]